MTITYQDMMPLLERRVSREVLNCLTSYASANNGRYPWAAPVTDVTTPYSDVINTRFGRLPDCTDVADCCSELSLRLRSSEDCFSRSARLTPALCMSSKLARFDRDPALLLRQQLVTNLEGAGVSMLWPQRTHPIS